MWSVIPFNVLYRFRQCLEALHTYFSPEPSPSLHHLMFEVFGIDGSIEQEGTMAGVDKAGVETDDETGGGREKVSEDKVTSV